MIVAFFESIKYVGHLVPIAFLRVYVGAVFLERAIARYTGEFLTTPQLATTITELLPKAHAPAEYKNFLEFTVVPHWRIFAHLFTYCEFLIAFCLLLGFLVRPIAIVSIGLLVAIAYLGNAATLEYNKLMIAIFVAFYWLGAGRCLGLDYFFYKRNRGIWW